MGFQSTFFFFFLRAGMQRVLYPRMALSSLHSGEWPWPLRSSFFQLWTSTFIYKVLMIYIGQCSVLWQSQNDSDTPKHHGLRAGGSQKLNRTTSVSAKLELARNICTHHWPGELCVSKFVVYGFPYPWRIVVPGQHLYPGAPGHDWRILGLS